MGIKINNQSIEKLYLGNIAVRRAYSNGSIVYDSSVTPTPHPCFEVVDTITNASGNYIDVYATDTQKWYKKNNLNQYEEYGIVDEAYDLSTLTYYTGKLAVCTEDDHEYKWNGSEWIDLGGCGRTCYFDGGDGGSYRMEIGYYWGNRYEFRLQAKKSSAYSDGVPIQTGSTHGGNTSPIELGWYSNGFFLDRHNPKSTSNYECNNTDFDKRTNKWTCLNNYTNTWLEFRLSFDSVTIYNATSGAVITSKSSGSASNSWYSGLYYGDIALSNTNKASIRNCIILDENNVVKHNYIFRVNRSLPDTKKLCLYDQITGIEYSGFSNSVSPLYHFEGTRTLPEQYDTKVAPPDYVHYNTLAELELMECPWYGMTATIGVNYEPYIYTTVGWIRKPQFEVVWTKDQASGNFIDVYSEYDSKWYKKNNLNQYEEYGVMPIVGDLSTVTYYTGKLVMLATDSHEYKWNGTTWVDLGSVGQITTRYKLKASDGYNPNKVHFPINHYFGTGYRVDVGVNISATNSLYFGGILFDFNSTSPFDIYNSGGGLRLRSFKPASTSDNSVNSVVNTTISDVFKTSSLTKKPLIFRCWNDKISVIDETTGTQLYTAGTQNTITGWYDGLYSVEIDPVQNVDFYYYKVYDSNGNLVNDIVTKYHPELSNKRQISLYDNILGVDVENTSSTAVTNYEAEYYGNITPVENYVTKSTPDDYVVCSTVSDLDAIVNVWYEQQANVGNNVYFFTKTGWKKSLAPDNKNYLTIEYNFPSDSFYITSQHVYYSINGSVWKKLKANTIIHQIAGGTTIKIKANLINLDNKYNFSFKGLHGNVYGNIMSLIYCDEFEGKTEIIYDRQFADLFYEQTVFSASNLILPATKLTSGCYNGMFYGCNELLSAPALQATELASSCYAYMFYRCSKLKTAPDLPALTLVLNSYNFMFYGCSQLNYIKAMFTTKPGYNYTYYWVSSVASSGTFVKNVNATWTDTGTHSVPSGWTVETVDP